MNEYMEAYAIILIVRESCCVLCAMCVPLAQSLTECAHMEARDTNTISFESGNR